MYRARQLSGAALAITMFGFLMLTLSASAEAQEDQIVEVNLTQSRDSGVSGTATLEDVEDGVEVTLQMQNLPEAGIKHINHIHAGGTCADDRAGRTAPVTIPLEPITAQDDGTGSATTTIEDVSVAQLFGEDKERFVLLHAETKRARGYLRGSPARIWLPWRKPAASGQRLFSSRERPRSWVLRLGFSSCIGASVLRTRRHAYFALCNAPGRHRNSGR
jgi:hypothetical protein